jgi:hypothetical protein
VKIHLHSFTVKNWICFPLIGEDRAAGQNQPQAIVRLLGRIFCNNRVELQDEFAMRDFMPLHFEPRREL